MGREAGGGSGWGTHVNPWLIHVNVWQKPLQCCKVISLQLIKNKGEKKRMLLDDFTSICLDLFNKYIFLSSPFFFFSIFHFLCPFSACANRPSVKCQVKGKLGWVFSSVSVAQSYPTLQPHGLQHTRLPCPSPAPELVQTHIH